MLKRAITKCYLIPIQSFSDIITNSSSETSETAESSESDFGDKLENLASSFLEKLINSYKASNLSDLTSSLSEAV